MVRPRSPVDVRVVQEPGLRYFLEVVRCGSIAMAASKLNVTSSAISRQITRLEEGLNTQLFERKARGMAPSASGELLASYALHVQLETDRIGHEILALSGLRRGTIKVASTEIFAVEFLPRLIVDFRERYGGLQVDLLVETSGEVADVIRSGDADIGLTFSLTPEPDIHIEYRQHAPIRAIAHRSHPLASKKYVSFSQLAPYPMALPRKGIMMRNIIDACCSRQGLVVEPVFSSNSIDALFNFVRLRGGVTFSSELPIEQLLSQGDLIAIPIRDHDMGAMQLEVRTLAGRTLPKASAFFLQEVVKRLASFSPDP